MINHLEKECGYNRTGIIMTCGKCEEKVFKQHLLNKHINECPKRDIECFLCKMMVPFDQSNEHKSTCPWQTHIKCDICKEHFRRTLIDTHRLKCQPKQKFIKNISRQRGINITNSKTDDIKDRLRRKIEKKSKLERIVS